MSAALEALLSACGLVLSRLQLFTVVLQKILVTVVLLLPENERKKNREPTQQLKENKKRDHSTQMILSYFAQYRKHFCLLIEVNSNMCVVVDTISRRSALIKAIEASRPDFPMKTAMLIVSA